MTTLTTTKKYQRSNAKEVRETIQNHILGFFQAEDYDVKTNLEALKKQVEYMKFSPKHTDYEMGVKLVEGGSLLIYTDEIEEFLESLDCVLNRKAEAFDNYKYLVGREVSYLCSLESK